MRTALAGLLAAVGCLWANDTAATLGAGGLVPVRAPGIAMESEDLRMSLREITVEYRLRNTTGQHIEAIVAFPLPPLNGGDVARSRPPSPGSASQEPCSIPVMTCMPGLARAGAGTYGMDRQNSRPERDVRLQIVQCAETR